MWIVIAGWLAAALVFSSFFMRAMIPLRTAAIASNVAFVSYGLLGFAYGVFDRVFPILALHACLLPLNLVRLRELSRARGAIRASSADDALIALIPHTRIERHERGDVLFRGGDSVGKLYVVLEGSVWLHEIKKRIPPGGVFGEIGRFAPQAVRPLTATCERNCRLAAIGADQVRELYESNPRLGAFLMHHTAGFVVQDRAAA